ncbi:MAG: hypothetical protein AAF850_05055 [Pseudomonadota bacterium]
MTYTASRSGDTNSQLPEPDVKTAFILGNGPSLADVDLKKLTPFGTFGMNAAYRFWRQIDWRPTHYVCLDTVVGLSHKQAISDLIAEGEIEQFLLRSNLIEALGRNAATRRVQNFDALAARSPLFADPGVTTGAGAALWAASLGFRRLVILGVDGRYREIVDGAQRCDGIELEIVEKKANPNYFFDNYQQPGDRYNLPNPRPDLHVETWRQAADKLKALEIEVYNGSPSSAVRVFPFIDLDALLEGRMETVPADEPLSEKNIDLHEIPGADEIGRRKLFRFLKRNAPGLGIAGILVFAFCSLSVSVAGPIIGGVIGFLSASLFFVLLFLLYFRASASTAINRLHRDIARLEARLLDVERLSGAPDRIEENRSKDD